MALRNRIKTWIGEHWAKAKTPTTSPSRESNTWIRLNLVQLGQLCPFFVWLQGGLVIRMGPSLRQCLAVGDGSEPSLSGLFTLVTPEDGALVSWQEPEALLDRPLELRSHNNLLFSGELVALVEGQWLLVLQPMANSLRELNHYGLTLQELSLSDRLRQQVLPSLLNEGLQDLLLQEASVNLEERSAEQRANDWLDIEL